MMAAGWQFRCVTPSGKAKGVDNQPPLLCFCRDDQTFGCIKCNFNLLIFNGAILYY